MTNPLLQTPVGDSPYTLDIIGGPPVAGSTDITLETAVEPGSNSKFVAGQTANIYIDMRDKYGNVPTLDIDVEIRYVRLFVTRNSIYDVQSIYDEAHVRIPARLEVCPWLSPMQDCCRIELLFALLCVAFCCRGITYPKTRTSGVTDAAELVMKTIHSYHDKREHMHIS